MTTALSNRATDLHRRVADALESERENLIADTARLLQFRTVSGGVGEEQETYLREIPRALEFLRSVGERMGFTYREVNGRAAEIAWEAATPAPGRKTMGIAAHIDVVTIAGNWTHDAFSGAVVDGEIWGRGTQDDKAPLMASLYGMYAVKKAGIEPAVDVRLIIGTCEETGDWSDIADYLRERGAPDFSFTPDATFPITNGEKGLITIEFSATWEPVETDLQTGMRFLSFKGGERANMVPTLCEAVFEYPVQKRAELAKEMMRETTRFTVEHPQSNVTILPRENAGDATGQMVITFLGKPAHGSLPHLGHNAAIDGALFFSDMETLPSAVRAFIQFLALIGKETDGSNMMIASEHPVLGKTTVNMGVVTIGPTGGTALLNVRPTMGMPTATVLENARTAAATFGEVACLDIGVKIHSRALEAIYMDPESEAVAGFIRALREAFTAETGRPATLESIGGTTYAKALPNCCAFGPVLTPDEEELAHQANERIPVEALVRNAKIYGASIALMEAE